MKSINETFTDEEHAMLVKAKGDLSWHDFIIRGAEHDRRNKGVSGND